MRGEGDGGRANGAAPRRASPGLPIDYDQVRSQLSQAEADVAAYGSRVGSLHARLARLEERAAQIPAVEVDLARLTRDYDVLRQQYDKLLQDREELRLRGEVKTEREAVKFQVVDPPTTPRAPVAPNRPLLLIGVLIVGIGAGVGAAFALGQLRTTFATTSKLEAATGLPVLGSISRTLTDAAQAARLRQRKLFFAGLGALGGLFALLMAVEFVQRGMVA